jgi:hypothetical protein
MTIDDVDRHIATATCQWCGVPLVPEDGTWTEPGGTGDYCPEGLAVGRTGTSPHLPVFKEASPVLRPCHVTGMHEPDHHLRREYPCDIQARDVADQLLAGRDLSTLPRALHPDCYWCGTQPDSLGRFIATAKDHLNWLDADPNGYAP